jgi:hypothetical protein
MTLVHLLIHVRSDDEDGESAKMIGVYSSEEAARAAIERVKDQAGFADHPDGFHIDQYEIDHDNWSEGFISWDEAYSPNA